MANNEIQEICLLWGSWQLQYWWSCMSKSEWASWAQFAGTVLAIILSGWIAARQFINAEIIKEESSARQLVHFYAQVQIFFNNIDQLKIAIDNKKINIESIINYRLVLQEYFYILRNIKIEDLSAEWATVCVFSRTTVAQMIGILESMENKFGSYLSDRCEIIEKFHKNDERRKKFIDDSYSAVSNSLSSSLLVLKSYKKSIDENERILFLNINKSSRFSNNKSILKHFSIKSIKEDV